MEDFQFRRFAGNRELKKYLDDGKVLPRSQAIRAKCADCMGAYEDGAMDCKIPTCPLYPYMPYHGKK